MSEGYIYLFECVTDYETTYKIGFTRNKNFKKRIKALQTGNKYKITCIDYFKTEYFKNITKNIEQLIKELEKQK